MRSVLVLAEFASGDATLFEIWRYFVRPELNLQLPSTDLVLTDAVIPAVGKAALVLRACCGLP